MDTLDPSIAAYFKAKEDAPAQKVSIVFVPLPPGERKPLKFKNFDAPPLAHNKQGAQQKFMLPVDYEAPRQRSKRFKVGVTVDAEGKRTVHAQYTRPEDMKSLPEGWSIVPLPKKD